MCICVDQVVDIGVSLHDQNEIKQGKKVPREDKEDGNDCESDEEEKEVQKLDNKYLDGKLAIPQARKYNTENSNSRVLKLLMSIDGNTKIWGFEYEKFENLNI